MPQPSYPYYSDPPRYEQSGFGVYNNGFNLHQTKSPRNEGRRSPGPDNWASRVADLRKSPQPDPQFFRPPPADLGRRSPGPPSPTYHNNKDVLSARHSINIRPQSPDLGTPCRSSPRLQLLSCRDSVSSLDSLRPPKYMDELHSSRPLSPTNLDSSKSRFGNRDSVNAEKVEWKATRLPSPTRQPQNIGSTNQPNHINKSQGFTQEPIVNLRHRSPGPEARFVSRSPTLANRSPKRGEVGSPRKPFDPRPIANVLPGDEFDIDTHPSPPPLYNSHKPRHEDQYFDSFQNKPQGKLVCASSPPRAPIVPNSRSVSQPPSRNTSPLRNAANIVRSPTDNNVSWEQRNPPPYDRQPFSKPEFASNNKASPPSPHRPNLNHQTSAPPPRGPQQQSHQQVFREDAHRNNGAHYSKVINQSNTISNTRPHSPTPADHTNTHSPNKPYIPPLNTQVLQNLQPSGPSCYNVRDTSPGRSSSSSSSHYEDSPKQVHNSHASRSLSSPFSNNIPAPVKPPTHNFSNISETCSEDRIAQRLAELERDFESMMHREREHARARRSRELAAHRDKGIE